MALKIKSYFNKDTPRCRDLDNFFLKQLPMVQYATVRYEDLRAAANSYPDPIV